MMLKSYLRQMFKTKKSAGYTVSTIGWLDSQLRISPAKITFKLWMMYESILDIYLGQNVSTFNYEGIQYTPVQFWQ